MIHNHEVAGSSPALATLKMRRLRINFGTAFFYRMQRWVFFLL